QGGARARERGCRLSRHPGRERRQGRPRGAPGRRDSFPGQSGLMAYEFKLPDLGEGLTEGEVARWLVSEGQEVAEDEPLVEIQTDKTTVEIPSPAAGVVSRILVEEGKVVPVGTILVVIGGDGAAPEPATPSVKEVGRRVRATPLVKLYAMEPAGTITTCAGCGV